MKIIKQFKIYLSLYLVKRNLKICSAFFISYEIFFPKHNNHYEKELKHKKFHFFFHFQI